MVLYPEKIVTNSRREQVRTWDEDNPTTIKVNVVTGRQLEAELPGQMSVKRLRCISRIPVPGPWGRVFFRGEWWDIEVTPTESAGVTWLTKHWEFAIRSRNDLADG